MEEKHSFRLFLIEASAGFLAFLIILAAVERSGAFDFHFREHTATHRWIEFYETALDDEIDVLIVGNSQSLTAVDCELLSTRLNKNFFAIGHDGATISSFLMPSSSSTATRTADSTRRACDWPRRCDHFKLILERAPCAELHEPFCYLP